MFKITNPIGHPTMRIKDILPSKSIAFSPNLYHWMKAHGHQYINGGVAQTVYRVKENSTLSNSYGAGSLLIGCSYNQHENDNDFSGSILMAVLCKGSKEISYCYPGAMRSLEVVNDFWNQYLKIGRCAIDTNHENHFLGNDRYKFDGDIRTCLWCGKQHKKIISPRIVLEETWV